MNSKVVNKIYRLWENRLRKANKNEKGTNLTKALPTNDAANAVLKNMLLEFGVPISEVDKLVYDIIPNKFSLFQEAKDETEGDVSFYMEQLEDYFRNRYKPSKGLESAVRVLGL